MFKTQVAVRIALSPTASARHVKMFVPRTVTFKHVAGTRGFRVTTIRSSRPLLTGVASDWKARMKQRLRIGLIICAGALALLDLQDNVPITNRIRYCVVTRTVEQLVSPKIRQIKDRQLGTSHDLLSRPDHDLLQGIMVKLQNPTGQTTWEAILVDDGQRMYAACGHVGAIYITQRLLDWCRTEDELAWVLSHELSHGIARHRWEVAGKMTVYALIAPFFGPVPAFIATALYGLHLIRQFELEADAIGVSLMVQAGYDPMAAVQSMQDFDQLTLAARQGRSFLQRLRNMPPLRPHPPLGVRISEMERHISALS